METCLLIVYVRLGMKHAVRLDENDPLLGVILDPHDEVRVEPPLLEEPFRGESEEPQTLRDTGTGDPQLSGQVSRREVVPIC